MSATIAVQSGGVVIAFAANHATANSSWIGLSERFDEAVEATSFHTGASDAFAFAQDLTVTCDPAATSAVRHLSLVAFR
jgi:hypothetical protein